MPNSQSLISRPPSTPSLDIRLRPFELRETLLKEARLGLQKDPKEVSCKWLYDAKGSLLFDQITRLPEYYPTRTERDLLRRNARTIAAGFRPRCLVELGSGSAEKTRLLLDALSDTGALETYIPLDVSVEALRDSVQSISADYPEIEVRGVVGDFDQHLGPWTSPGRKLVAFLGGTIGNFQPEERSAFLDRLASVLAPGDLFLLGTDLVKDVRRVEAAYNDRQGVTAEFNLNVLEVLNRELGAHFDRTGFRHLARFDAHHRWIEMLLISTRRQRVAVDALKTELVFHEGEYLRTEVSTKFEPLEVDSELSQAGFELLHWWTDPQQDFGLSLSRLRGRH